MAMKAQRPQPAPDEDAAEKLLPQNVDAEAGVLGSLLIDPEAFPEVSPYLKADDFYREAHRAIYQAIGDLWENKTPADLITLTDELGRRGKLEDIGGLSYVSSLANQVPTSANIDYYGRIVERMSYLRGLIHDAGQIAAVAYNTPEAGVALTQANALIQRRLERYTAGRRSLRVEAQEAADLLDKEIAPPKWAVPNLFAEGLTIFAGAPKRGKSSLTLGVLLAVGFGGVALGKIRVERGEALYLALEDNERRMHRRLSSMLGYGDKKAPRGLFLRYDWPKLDAGGIEMLDAWIAQHPKTRIIVVDTYKRVKPSDDPKQRNATLYDSDYQALLPLQLWAVRAGVAVVVITHTRKSTAESVIDEISGSTGLTGVADNIVVMRRSGDVTELHRQGRDFTDDTVWALQGDPVTLHWTIQGPVQDVKRSEERQAIIDALRTVGRALKASELAPLVRKPESNVRHMLHKMCDSGDTELRYDATSHRYSYHDSTSLIEREVTRVTEVTQVTGVTGVTNSLDEKSVTPVTPIPIRGVTNTSPDVVEAGDDSVTPLPLLPHLRKETFEQCPMRDPGEPHVFRRNNPGAFVRLCKYCDAVEPNKALGAYAPD